MRIPWPHQGRYEEPDCVERIAHIYEWEVVYVKTALRKDTSFETIIHYEKNASEVHIYTGYQPTKRKMEKAGLQPVKATTYHGEESGWWFRVPFSRFKWRIRTGESKRPPITEMQKTRLRAAKEVKA